MSAVSEERTVELAIQAEGLRKRYGDHEALRAEELLRSEERALEGQQLEIV